MGLEAFYFSFSLYVPNLIFCFGCNTATKEGICLSLLLQLTIASSACLPQQLCFVSRNVKSVVSGQEVAGIAMETDFLQHSLEIVSPDCFRVNQIINR